jgi:DNA-binding NtrC family response regulator
LQTGEFQRLGSNATHKTDVRLISATNANLPNCIKQGQFREDLYFRLNVIELAIPALRDRTDDILPLAEHLLQKHVLADSSPFRLTDSARQALLDHEWPGNVRELDNRIQRAVLVSKEAMITPGDLGLDGSAVTAARSSAPAAPQPRPPAAGDERGTAFDAMERAQIEKVLTDARGVVSKAAAELGISRQALYRRMERLGIELERRMKS